MKIDYENKIKILNKKIEEMNKDKSDLKETINILENLIIKEKEKFVKLFSLSKAKIDKLNKEILELNEEIIKLKNKNMINEENSKSKINDKEMKYNYELIKQNDKYEKKIKRLYKIIEELNSRIGVLYIELSQKNL